MDKEQAERIIILLERLVHVQAMRGYNEARLAESYSIGFTGEDFVRVTKL